MLNKELLDIIACPKCKGDLEYKNQGLICLGCKLKYIVKDDIPIMLIDDAEQLE